MLKKIKLFMMLALFALSSISAFAESEQYEKIFVDDSVFINKNLQFSPTDDCFYVHVGQNLWVKSNQMQVDKNALLNRSISFENFAAGNEYIKQWKCPYCNQWWLEGQRCGNASCPSKYRG